jgi:methyl-accepting chemotaxis protein
MKAPTAFRNRRRFRSHLINHELRFRLVADDMLFALLAALAAIGILYYLSNREIGDTLWSAHLSLKETRELLSKGVVVAGIVTFFAVLVFGFWSMLDAHRIAGPIHRLKILLDEVAGGKLTHEIEFRRRDEFHELAASADALVESYRGKIKDLKALTDSMETAVRALPAEQAGELSKRLEELQSSLRSFQVGDAEEEEPK